MISSITSNNNVAVVLLQAEIKQMLYFDTLGGENGFSFYGFPDDSQYLRLNIFILCLTLHYVLCCTQISVLFEKYLRQEKVVNLKESDVSTQY